MHVLCPNLLAEKLSSSILYWLPTPYRMKFSSLYKAHPLPSSLILNQISSHIRYLPKLWTPGRGSSVFCNSLCLPTSFLLQNSNSSGLQFKCWPSMTPVLTPRSSSVLEAPPPCSHVVPASSFYNNTAYYVIMLERKSHFPLDSEPPQGKRHTRFLLNPQRTAGFSILNTHPLGAYFWDTEVKYRDKWQVKNNTSSVLCALCPVRATEGTPRP